MGMYMCACIMCEGVSFGIGSHVQCMLTAAYSDNITIQSCMCRLMCSRPVNKMK